MSGVETCCPDSSKQSVATMAGTNQRMISDLFHDDNKADLRKFSWKMNETTLE